MKQFWNNLSDRDRLMLKVLAGFLAVVVLYFAGMETVWAYHENLGAQISKESQLFEKYRSTVDHEARIRRDMKSFQNLSKAMDRSLLPGTTPELALPELNTIIKNLAQKHKIDLERLKPRSTKEHNEFIEVSVSFPIRANTTQLLNFLYDLETNDKFLIVRELQVNVTRLKNPTDFKADLVVSGLIRKTLAEDEETQS